MSASIGTNEGERCNRDAGDGMLCDGKMIGQGGLNCSCHISPPCGSCIETGIRCSVCDEYGEDA